MTGTNQKRVVLVYKPLPGLLDDLARIRPENSETVHLVVDKKRIVVATTLTDPALDKEVNNERK